ncbi:MAG: UTRA domain-containing protein, partial [Gordonia amarae]
VAARLSRQPGEPVVFIERLRFLDDLPLSLDTTYLDPGIGAAVLRRPLESNDIFALIEELTGHRLGHADLAVEAVAADAHSAAILAIPQSSPVLLMERLTHADGGEPVDLEYIRLRGDRITLRGKLTRSQGELS